MKRESQTDYAELGADGSLAEEPLVIHQRSDPTTSHSLIIFVHGLGGARYGAKATWGKFPEFIFRDLPDLDVGMYQYRTLLGRFRFSRSISLETEAEILAQIIRDDVASYKNIILVGHSMGGLLCKAVIHHLVTNGDRDSLNRIAGLILMATPQLGSLRVPAALSWLSRDAQALKPHSSLIGKVQKTFEDHIALDERTNTHRKFTIPTWAITAANDLWVDPLSSGIGLTSSRIKLSRGSHTEIVKPPDRNSNVYQWVLTQIKTALGRFRYDVFLAAAMAGHSTDAEYEQSRAEVLELIDILETQCGCKVFYAGRTLKTKAQFEPKVLALNDDLDALRASRNFIFYYPERVVSSVIYEAGWALILGKPSIYVVRKDEHLPFLLKEAQQAFDRQRVRIFECADHKSTLETFAAYGRRLFYLGPDRTGA
jgi:pimeloyl-ACP methyl ester carboxylesterase